MLAEMNRNQDTVEARVIDGATPAVIVVSAMPVFPCVQGNRRVLRQLLEFLEREGFYTVLVHQERAITDEAKELHRQLVNEYRPVEAPSAALDRRTGALAKFRRFSRKIVRKIQGVLASATARHGVSEIAESTPHSAYEPRTCWEETKVCVSEVLASRPCTAVIAEYHFMTPVFDIVPSPVLKIVQTIDAHSKIREQIGSRGADTQGREISFEEERRRLLRADVVIGIQEVETQYFRKMLPERLVITVGFAAEWSAEPKSERQVAIEPVILFIGSKNPLNQHGIEGFLSFAWPQILVRHPAARCVVIGGVGELLECKRFRGVDVRGIVSDPGKEWKRAAVVINPVELGTGLKIKTIEAIARGKAIVSSPEGVAGIGSSELDSPVLVAEDWDSFALIINGLLDEPQRILQLEERAIDFAEEHLSFSKVYASLRAVLLHSH